MASTVRVAVVDESPLAAQVLAAGLNRAGVRATVCGAGAAQRHSGPVLLRWPAGRDRGGVLARLPWDRTVVIAGSRRIASLATAVSPAAVVPADAGLSSLCDVLAAVARGEDPRPPEWRPVGVPPLTEREIEVLDHVARGQDDAAIAEGLGIARRTAGTHVQRALEKLGVTSRVAAVLVLRESGVLDDAR